MANECKQELAERDQEIEELKETLTEEFHYQSEYVQRKKTSFFSSSVIPSSEYLKFLKATERACHLESQKRDVLQGYVDNYENHVYRV